MYRSKLRRLWWPCVIDPESARDVGHLRYRLDTAAERDIGVRYAVWLLGLVLTTINPAFRLLRHLLSPPETASNRRRWQGTAYAYAALWSTVLILLWVSGWGTAAAILAALRLAEIMVWYAMALLDRGHRFVLSYERSLLLLFVDLLIAVTCIGLLLRVGSSDREDFGHWLDGLAVLVFNGSPTLDYPYGPWESAGVAAGTIAGLLIIGAGLALVVGLIVARFRLGQHEYTGPMRPPWPGGRASFDTRQEDGSTASVRAAQSTRPTSWP